MSVGSPRCVTLSLLLTLLTATLVGCGADEEWEDVVEALPAVLSGYSALTSGEFLSVNGSYGAQCTGRVGQSWSVAVVDGAPLDNTALTVVRGNSACALTISGLRTASYLYTASPGFVVGGAYQASSVLYGAVGSVSFRLNARLSDPTFTSAIALTLRHSADPTVAAYSNASFYPYEKVVTDTSGLVSYWRLNELGAAVPFVEDDFSGSAGALLSSRAGALNATWTRDTNASFPNTGVLTTAGRVYSKEYVGGDSERVYGTVYTASGTPGSANYAAEATVHMRSVLQNADAAGVIVRASSGTHYFGGYYNNEDRVTDRWWKIRKCQGGACSDKAIVNANVSALSNYLVRLEVTGSTTTTLKLYVNGVETLTFNDATSPITSAGKAGIRIGGDPEVDNDAVTNQSDTEGAHLDDFRAESLVSASAADVKGAHEGTYYGPSRGATGALTGNSDTGVTFDGVDDYIAAGRGISDSFSIELWFKTATPTAASTNTHWFTTTNRGLFDANQVSSILDFGVSMRPDGKILAGIGQGTDATSASILSSSAYNDGAFHHLVFTRRRGTNSTTDPSALALYLDGALAASSITSTNISALTGATDINIGRLRSNSGYFVGSIDEVAVYGTVLTNAIVLNHYQTGKLKR